MSQGQVLYVQLFTLLIIIGLAHKLEVSNLSLQLYMSERFQLFRLTKRIILFPSMKAKKLENIRMKKVGLL